MLLSSPKVGCHCTPWVARRRLAVGVLLCLACNLLASDRDARAADDAEPRAVLVTGASSGIGFSIAETLASNDFYVYAGARDRDDLERLDAMDNVSAVRLDVTSREDIEAAVAFVAGEGRGLWGIVNNAGILRYAPLATGALREAQATFDVNFFGPLRINQAFLPFVIDSGGRTAVIGSINGFAASPRDGGYSASKFAVEGYTDSLALELAALGVHVGIVEPGAYRTSIRDEMVARALAAADGGDLVLNDAAREELEAIAAGNDGLPEPDAVAAAVLHLMSSDAPRRRYLVTPSAAQAGLAIRAVLRHAVELNDEQAHSLGRDELVALLDELLDRQSSD